MDVSPEDLKVLYRVATDQAIEIWTNRANGIEDDRYCPFCSVRDLIEPLKASLDETMCYHCPLIDCFNTPYGLYHDGEEYIVDPIGLRGAAENMVKMLVAYRDGDMETFKYYLNFYC